MISKQPIYICPLQLQKGTIPIDNGAYFQLELRVVNLKRRRALFMVNLELETAKQPLFGWEQSKKHSQVNVYSRGEVGNIFPS